MKATLFFLSLLLAFPLPCLAVEVAGRITDREIVERLAKLDARMVGLQKRLEEGLAALNKRIDDLRSEMNGRFDTLQWTLSLFITISLIILGFVLRLQWQMSRRQSQMETTLETH